MRASTKMALLSMAMFIIGFLGLKTFLDNHMTVLPILCIIAFVLAFIQLVRWNIDRLRGN